MIFRQLIDRPTCTYTYLLADPTTREAVLIDPVRDQIERDVQLLEELGLELKYTLETHVHADHVTSSGLLRGRLGLARWSRPPAAPPVRIGPSWETAFNSVSAPWRCAPPLATPTAA